MSEPFEPTATEVEDILTCEQDCYVIEFEIVDLNLDGLGNDLTLDDISLDGPVPVPEPTTFLLAAMLLLGILLGCRR